MQGPRFTSCSHQQQEGDGSHQGTNGVAMVAVHLQGHSWHQGHTHRARENGRGKNETQDLRRLAIEKKRNK